MQEQTQSVEHKKRLKIEVKLLPDGDYKKIEVEPTDTILEVMIQSAAELGVEILPPQPLSPLDQFFCVDNHDHPHGPIENLSQSMKDLMDEKDCKKRLALGLALAFKVNASWRVATQEQMTPEEILALFGMDFSQFTLYRPDSESPLPLDEPIKIVRGMCLEAIKDGRYGSGL